MTKLFRKKSEEIEACQYLGDIESQNKIDNLLGEPTIELPNVKMLYSEKYKIMISSMDYVYKTNSGFISTLPSEQFKKHYEEI